MGKHVIIGCGGIGGWLVPLLLKMKDRDDQLLLMDGDRVEARNFDRQMFQSEHLGWNKAQALAATYGGLDFIPRYLQKSTRAEVPPESWIWCCVDNHPARAACLEWVDDLYNQRLNLVLGGNEYEYQEAYLYFPIWKNCGYLDPRIKYPEILTDKSGDPARPACTGLGAKENPQLALFNFLAAGAMVHLWLFHTRWASETLVEHWPVGHSANRARMQTIITPNVIELVQQMEREENS